MLRIADEYPIETFPYIVQASHPEYDNGTWYDDSAFSCLHTAKEQVKRLVTGGWNTRIVERKVIG